MVKIKHLTTPSRYQHQIKLRTESARPPGKASLRANWLRARINLSPEKVVKEATKQFRIKI